MSGPASDLFPLPVAPFEWYMLEDGNADFPTTATVTVEVTGRLDHEAFRAAVNDSLLRHPLMTCTIARRGSRRPVWVFSSQPADMRFVDGYFTQFPDIVAAGGQSAAPRSEHGFTSHTPPVCSIDLTQQPGLRITVYEDEDRAAICFDFHHAAADGIGCHRFIGDVFGLYGQRTCYDTPPELAPLDASLLRRRDRLSPEVRAAMRRPEYWRKLLVGAYCYLGRKPAMTSARADSASGTDGKGIEARSRWLAASDVRRLRRILHERKLTLNDLLLTHLFSALKDWNEKHGDNRQRPIRLVVPNNLRGTDKTQLPAANVLHYLFLSFRPSDISDAPEFAEAVARRMRFYGELYAGSMFAIFFSGMSWVPGLLPFLVARSGAKATAVASFMGDPTRSYATRFPREEGRCVAGNLVIERFSVRGTVRRGTFVNLSASVYADQLALSITVDERHCGAGAADDFADDLQRRVLAEISQCDGGQ